MSAISAHNNVKYVDSKFLLSRVKRELKSFDQMGLIDSNDFYEYAMDVLNALHLGGYVEANTIMEVTKGKAKLPDNFKYIYSAHLCNLTGTTKTHPRFQKGYVFYTDTIYEEIQPKGCKFAQITSNTGFKITIREYIDGIESIDNYNLNITKPLHITSQKYCAKAWYHPDSCNEASIENGYLHTNFDSGTIYMKYYALPIDEETGLPLIPDSEVIQKAIRYYSISQYFLNWYWNDEVPNGVAQKAAEAKKLYLEAFGQAVHESKLPHFATLVDYIRTQRQRLNTYQQIDYNT